MCNQNNSNYITPYDKRQLKSLYLPSKQHFLSLTVWIQTQKWPICLLSVIVRALMLLNSPHPGSGTKKAQAK